MTPKVRWMERNSAATALLCVVGLSKFLLVRGHEIASSSNDAQGYVQLASGIPWATVGSSPGYSIWLWLCAQTGVPQRIAIEALFVLSCAASSWTLAFAVTNTRRSRHALYGVLLVPAAFSPVSFYLFDYALADGFFLCLTLIAICCAILATCLAHRSARWSLAFGACLGVMSITRKEMPLILLALTTFAVLMFAARRQLGARPRHALRSSVAMTTIASAIAIAIAQFVGYQHWKHEGVWTPDLSTLPSHIGLLERLAAIETGAAGQRYFPSSQQARRLAYRQSPTLAKLEPVVEDGENPYRKHSVLLLGHPGEIGAGWIWHVFNDAAGKIGIRDLKALDAFYEQANRELDDAFKNGRLRRHLFANALLGHDPRVWLPYLPSSIARVAQVMSHPMDRPIDERYRSELFDRVLNRRAALVAIPTITAEGWAYVEPNQPLAMLSLETEGRTYVLSAKARPDVGKAFLAEGRKLPDGIGFTATIPIPRPEASVVLRVETSDGRMLTARNPTVGNVLTMEDSSGGPRVIYAVDALPRLSPSGTSEGLRDRLIASLIKHATLAATAWFCLPILALGILLLLPHARKAADAWKRLIVMTTLLSWIVFRILLYALVDAAAWEAEPRYLQVSALLIAMATAMAGHSIIAWYSDRRMRSSRH